MRYQSIARVITFLLSLGPVLFCLLSYKFSFNYEVTLNQQYPLLLFVCLYNWVMTIVSFKTPTKMGFVVSNICNNVLLIAAILYSHNEYLCVCLNFTVLAISLSLSNNFSIIRYYLYFFFTLLSGEILIGIYQGFISMEPSGTLSNTGIYTMYLVIQIPIAYFFFLKLKTRIDSKTRYPQLKRSVFIICFLTLFLAIVYFVISLHSRTALLSLILLTLIIFYRDYIIWIRKKWVSHLRYVWFILIPLTASCTAGFSYYLFCIKKPSVYGRLLMMDVALQHIKDHLWFGTGMGRFTWYYPQWQSLYFLHNSRPPHNFLLAADESYIIFNEYLQLFETVGIFLFIAFLIILVRFFKTSSLENNDLLVTLKLTVIAILSCGFTSYPFHVNILLLEFILCLFVAFKIRDKKPGLWLQFLENKNRTLKYFFLTVCLISSTYIAVLAYKKNEAIRDWQKLKEDNLLSHADKKITYSKLYLELHHDGKFLTDYGLFLSEDSLENHEAIKILREGKKYFISRRTIEALGYAYWQEKELKEAIECFKWVEDYLPNLFEPKLNLLELYIASGDTTEARKIGYQIITTSPKISSADVLYIKQEAQILVDGIFTTKPAFH